MIKTDMALCLGIVAMIAIAVITASDSVAAIHYGVRYIQ